MAITLESTGTVASTDASTVLTVSLPSGIQADDIGIWHTGVNKSTFAHVYPAEWTNPTGTLLDQTASTRTLGHSFAYRRFDGSTSGTVDVSHGGASTAVIMSNITLWRGVSTAAAAPYSAFSSTRGNSSIYTTEGLLASDTDKYLVILGNNTDDQAAMSVMSSGSGVSTSMTLGYNTEVTSGNGAIASMFHSQVISTGTIQGGVCRMGTVEVWGAIEILLAASTQAPVEFWWSPSMSLLGVQ